MNEQHDIHDFHFNCFHVFSSHKTTSLIYSNETNECRFDFVPFPFWCILILWNFILDLIWWRKCIKIWFTHSGKSSWCFSCDHNLCMMWRVLLIIAFLIFWYFQVIAAILVFSWVLSLSVCAVAIAYTKSYFFNENDTKVRNFE